MKKAERHREKESGVEGGRRREGKQLREKRGERKGGRKGKGGGGGRDILLFPRE